MVPRTSGIALLFFTLTATISTADGEERARPLAPTESELQSFRLPQPPSTSVPAEPYSLPDTSLFEIAGIGMFAASAADFGTTELGLARGLREGNPVASHRAIRLVHHVVGPAAVHWTTDRLARKGKPRLALGLRIALMAAYGYASLHNLRQVGSATPSP